MLPTDTFLQARDFLLRHRDDYDAAYAGFRWPEMPEFNWASTGSTSSPGATTARRCGSSARAATT